MRTNAQTKKRKVVSENFKSLGVLLDTMDSRPIRNEAFKNKEFNKEVSDLGYIFSSANSINIGRLIPQIVYYFYGYLNLLKKGKIEKNEKINIVVPTGNFGNILAAYYGKLMGLPVNKLICASNENNVLYDFMNTGIYNRNRDFKKTISPSMDILVSSNLERFLYEIANGDEKLIVNLMTDLNQKGIYEITDQMKTNLKGFHGGYAAKNDIYKAIKVMYESDKYLMDTHTAVGYSVYKSYREQTKDLTKTIIASTASPFKFPRDVLKAVHGKYDNFTDFELVDEISKLLDVDIPKGIKDLDKRKIIHKRTCKKNHIKEEITQKL